LHANINIGRGCAITALAKVLLKVALVKQQKAHSQIAYSLCGKYNERVESERFCITLVGRTACSTLTSSFHFIHFYILQGQFYAYIHGAALAQIGVYKLGFPFGAHIPLHPTTHGIRPAEKQKKSKSSRNLIHSGRVRKRKQSEC
jgi:hypothetical protein